MRVPFTIGTGHWLACAFPVGWRPLPVLSGSFLEHFAAPFDSTVVDVAADK